GGNNLLVVVDEVIHFPKSAGILLVGAASSERRGASPGMQHLDGEILEDDSDLRIVLEHSSQYVVQAAAHRTLEVGELDQGNGRFRVAEGRSIFRLDHGAVLGEGILGQV